MDSFRNRLLALIIGLVVTTQCVTLVAVLESTAHEARVQADERLRYGSQETREYLLDHANQLSATVATLAADIGIKETIASHDGPTMLSAVTNHSRHIGWDLVLFLDADGKLITSNSTEVSEHAPAVRKLADSLLNGRDDSHLVVLGSRLYQFVAAEVNAPEPIGWVVMGFAVDDASAAHVRDLTGSQISVVAGDGAQLRIVASTLAPEQRAALAAHHEVAGSTPTSQSRALGSQEFLTYVSRLGDASDSVAVVLQRPMDEVMAPYRTQRNALAAIGGIALAAAIAIALLLGQGATRPIGELVRAARRIQAGTYDKAVDVGGGDEFRSLAATFNAMQHGIAEREARISHDAHHDALTGLPNRAYAERHLEELLRASPPPAIALILLEVANLGEISASLGHHVGDEALRETGAAAAPQLRRKRHHRPPGVRPSSWCWCAAAPRRAPRCWPSSWSVRCAPVSVCWP